MPSFDVVSKPNLVELRNAVEQANKEIANRFDFKGSDARIEFAEGKELALTAFGDDEFKLGQVRDVLLAKLAKRSVDARFVELDGDVEPVGGDKVKLVAPIKAGIGSDDARRLQQLIKQSKLKVQAAIQGDVVRVSGGKKDDLQSAIALLRREIADLPLTYKNFRD